MSDKIVCIGSVLIDELYFCNEIVIAGTSNPAISMKSLGGVITNIAQHLALLETDVELITVIGNDTDGQWIKNELSQSRIKIDHSLHVNDNTGKYVSILNNDGSLFTAACVDVAETYLSPTFLESKQEVLSAATILIADANISTQTLQWLINYADLNQIPLIIEPVSVAKARKLAELDLRNVFMLTPNEDELFSLCRQHQVSATHAIQELLSGGVQHVWLRKGSNGSVLYSKNETIAVEAKNIAIVDTTGAGDAALAAWVVGFVKKYHLKKCLQLGHSLAFEVLQVKGAVYKNIHFESLLESLNKYYPDAE